MLRNYLISLLGEEDNDPVVVSLNGTLLDVETVTDGHGCILLVLTNDDTSPYILGKDPVPITPTQSASIPSSRPDRHLQEQR